jgi:hypothetical protein
MMLSDDRMGGSDRPHREAGNRLGMLMALCLLLMTSVGSAAEWTIEFTRDAAFLIRYDGATVVRSKYLAWGPRWKYASFDTEIGRNFGDRWLISGKVKDLNLEIGGQIGNDGPVTTFDYTLLATKPSQNNVGGGIQFDIRLDPQVFGNDISKPELTDTGWSWSPVPGQTVRVSFENAGAKPYFEKGSAGQIRTLFIPSDIRAGKREVTMKIELPPGSSRTDGASKFYDNASDHAWRPDTVDWTTTPIDLSYLNHKPAGQKGFVKADGDRLVFGDGTEARFWGANVQAYALFNATDQAIEQQARRIAALGFNLVRIHHHDSAEWSPSVFVKDADNTRVLDEKHLDRIDYWVKCLKDNGVYVWLDLHVGRPFRPGDQIEGFEELDTGKTGREAKGLNYVNKTVTDRMKEFAAAYLTRANRYTNVRYVDEPAVMGVLITNENDITNHFGNLFLTDKGNPIHKGWYDALRDTIGRERGIDLSVAWKTWEPGPSKVILNQVEYDWSVDFVQYLRSIGVKVPLATTNTWGSNPLFSLPALTAGDVIDVHAYGQAESISSNPKYDDMSSHWIAAAQVSGMPLVVTEWNTEFPQRDRFTQPLFIAANAAFQGWDAPMIYGYHQSPLVQPSKIDKWGISYDPSMVTLMPTAALIFRRGDVDRAKTTVVFAPGESLLTTSITPESSPALRTIAERHRLVIGLPKTPLLPWLNGVEQGASDPMQIADGVGETSITSDTGQLTRDWADGLYTINTPRTQAAMGWMKGREYKLADVTFRITTPKATVAVTSLDGEPIATSKQMLLTATAQAGMKGKPARVMAEMVEGEVDFGNPVRYQPLSPTGARLAPAVAGPVRLTAAAGTHWYIVTRD